MASKTLTTKLLVQFRAKDTKFGVTRRTVRNMADRLGLTDTDTLMYALARLRDQVIPAYAPDDGPLTQAQMEAIRKIEPQDGYAPTRSLFEGA